MCGWAGIFGKSASLDDLRAVGDLLATRGPDGHGEYASESSPLPFAVAHRRLAIMDTSDAGAQPMYLQADGVSVVYNGEIYNSPELRRELIDAGVRFTSSSDTEVLLRGWVAWGDEIVERIEGIFSFALVDAKRGRVVLARDRMGVKPLYWAMHDGHLVAGSAPRALLRLDSSLPRTLDQVALAQFLTLLWIPHPRTPWKAIHKLEPATILTFAGGRVETRRFWNPPQEGPAPLSPARLQDLLRISTERQLLSDVPVGLLFSGGLDSTLLLSLMSGAFESDPLHALTAGFDPSSQRLEINPDDTLYARQVVAHDPRVRLTEVELDLDAGRDLDTLSMHFDDPVADPAAISLYRLCQESDATVLLSGVGGEELFAGYPRHSNLDLARKLAKLPNSVRVSAAAAAPALYGATPGILHGTRRNMQKMLRAVGERQTPHYWRMMSQLTETELEALLPGVARAAFDELDAQSTPLATSSLGDALQFDRAQFLPNLNLAYVDKASMAAGIEVRVPLLDELVIQETMAAASGAMLAGGVTKAPLKQAARGLVPDSIIDRPKSGFGGPVRAWFQGPPGKELAERVDALADGGLVQREPARRIVASASSGKQDSALSAWALVCLQSWEQEHGSR